MTTDDLLLGGPPRHKVIHLACGAVITGHGETVALHIQDQVFQKGEQLRVPITTKDFNQLLGYQFTLEFDTRQLRFLSVDPAALADIGTQGFGERSIKKGILTTNWTNAFPVDLTDDAILFYLNFETRASGQLSDLINLNTDYLQQEAYQGLNAMFDVQLHWKEVVKDKPSMLLSDIYLHQNVPNPLCKGETTSITFVLPENVDLSFEVLSPAGKVIYSNTRRYSKGEHQIDLSSDLFKESGIYLYLLKTNTGDQISRRLLYIH